MGEGAGVLVDGTAVGVRVDVAVAVGGTAVFVGGTGVLVGTDVGVSASVAVGSTGVALGGTAVGVAPQFWRAAVE